MQVSLLFMLCADMLNNSPKMVYRSTKKAGYSISQINLFHPFIMQGKSAEEIMKLFGPDATDEKIINLAQLFG